MDEHRKCVYRGVAAGHHISGEYVFEKTEQRVEIVFGRKYSMKDELTERAEGCLYSLK